MRVIIITSFRRGTASYCVSELLEKTSVDIVHVVYSKGAITNKPKFYKRKLKKVWEIGLLGALNGLRIRSWFNTTERLKIEDIEELCKRNNIPFTITDSINSEQTKILVRKAEADLALSLGNSYISPGVFSIPKYGMLNIHGEVLPEYKNAQSVIWQLYNFSIYTGYTIHQVERSIDAGNIYKQEIIPIVFKATLSATVNFTCAEILVRAASGLADLLENFGRHRDAAIIQNEGKSYTTPSLRQFLRIHHNYRKMYKNMHT